MRRFLFELLDTVFGCSKLQKKSSNYFIFSGQSTIFSLIWRNPIKRFGEFRASPISNSRQYSAAPEMWIRLIIFVEEENYDYLIKMLHGDGWCGGRVFRRFRKRLSGSFRLKLARETGSGFAASNITFEFRKWPGANLTGAPWRSCSCANTVLF